MAGPHTAASRPTNGPNTTLSGATPRIPTAAKPQPLRLARTTMKTKTLLLALLLLTLTTCVAPTTLDTTAQRHLSGIQAQATLDALNAINAAETAQAAAGAIQATMQAGDA